MGPRGEEVGYSDGGYFRHFADTSSGLLFEFWKDEGEFGVRFFCDSALRITYYRICRCTVAPNSANFCFWRSIGAEISNSFMVIGGIIICKFTIRN